jgi:hypothetical protein
VYHGLRRPGWYRAVVTFVFWSVPGRQTVTPLVAMLFVDQLAIGLRGWRGVLEPLRPLTRAVPGDVLLMPSASACHRSPRVCLAAEDAMPDQGIRDPRARALATERAARS